jgi:hypothetical protein
MLYKPPNVKEFSNPFVIQMKHIGVLNDAIETDVDYCLEVG